MKTLKLVVYTKKRTSQSVILRGLLRPTHKHERRRPLGGPCRVLMCDLQKVAISENHKAQTLSAEADSYVKNTLFYVTRSNSKPPVKRVSDVRNVFTIMTQSHFAIPKS